MRVTPLEDHLHVTYDPEADAACIYLTSIPDSGVHRTYFAVPQEPGAMVNIDLNAEGRILGIEVIGARNHLPESLLRTAKLP